MASGFQAGSIVGSLVLDKTKWSQSVAGAKKDTKDMKGMSDKMSAGFKKAGKAMTVAGGLIVGTLGTMVKKYVEVGDWVDKMSKRTGFAATTLSELAYAADISGASLDDVEKGVKRMSKTIVDAGDGMATYVRAFARLGLKVEDIAKLGIEEQFFTIAEAIAKVESPTIRAAAAQDIFGRAGTKLLPLFAEGEKGLKALTEEAHELGIIFDKEAAAKAAKLKDAQTALKESFKGLGFMLADSLIPALTDFVGKITEVMKKVIAWVKKNPKLTETIVKITGGIGALMLVLGPLAMMLPGLAVMFGALTGPIGIVVAAIAGLIAVGTLVYKNWSKISEFLKNVWGGIKTVATNVFNGIKKVVIDALYWLVDKISKIPVVGKFVKGWKSALEDARAEVRKTKEEVTAAQVAMGKSIYESIKDQEWFAKVVKVGGTVLRAFAKDTEETIPPVVELNEKITRTYEIAETAAQNIGILTSSMGDFALKAVSTQEVLENLQPVMTRVWEEAIPPARDFSGIVDQVPTKLEDIKEKSEVTGTAVKSKWEEVADGIRTKWTTNLSEILQGSKSLTDGLKDIFGHIKGMFFDMVAEMVTKWIFEGVKSLVSGAAKAASGISSSFKSVGKAVSGIGAGIGQLIISLAKGIAGAAKIIAQAAPQILLAAAVALAIYAGFKVISALFKKTGKKDYMQLIADATIATRDMLRTDYKDEIHTTQNILRGIFEKVEAMCPKLDGVNKWLDEISNRLKDLSSVSAQSGLDMAITKPTMIMTHAGEHARITPAGHTSYGNVSLSFNIAAGDGRDMENWLRSKGARMIEDIMRQNLGGNAERIEADLARYRRY